MFNPYQDIKVTLEAIKEADNETLAGAGVDMQGYKGVMFVVAADGGEDLDFTIKAQVGTDSAFSDAADLAGTSVAFSTVASPDTNGFTTLTVVEPPERYVRASVAVPNAAAAQAVSVIAIRFGATYDPQSNTGELHVAPAEGTA